VRGYEIHHGIVTRDGGRPFFANEGCVTGNAPIPGSLAVAGTSWHGLLENDEFRRGYLAQVARACGRRFKVAPGTSFAAIREARLDRLADLVADNIDRAAIHRLLAEGSPPQPPLRLRLDPQDRGPA
jgi:adenosylcobyric acid synthase